MAPTARFAPLNSGDSIHFNPHGFPSASRLHVTSRPPFEIQVQNSEVFCTCWNNAREYDWCQHFSSWDWTKRLNVVANLVHGEVVRAPIADGLTSVHFKVSFVDPGGLTILEDVGDPTNTAVQKPSATLSRYDSFASFWNLLHEFYRATDWYRSSLKRISDGFVLPCPNTMHGTRDNLRTRDLLRAGYHPVTIALANSYTMHNWARCLSCLNFAISNASQTNNLASALQSGPGRNRA